MSIRHCTFQRLLFFALLVHAAGGCSDDGLTPAPQPDAMHAELPTADATHVADAADDAGQDTAKVDAALADAGSVDTGVIGVDVATLDTQPDETAPTVIGTVPASQSDGVVLPFTVQVQFNERISPNTIAPQTVRLFGPGGTEVTGTPTLNATGETLTFIPSPEETLQYASPYRIWLAGGIIADLAGNKLEANFESTFYTADFPNMSLYQALAAQYSPTIHSASIPSVGASQAQVPVAFNADGDWDGSNNQTWVQSGTDTLLPTVYYDVVETPTHYFIHYLFFFPWVNHPSDSYSHANGANGAMVVVEKSRANTPERPVGVTTYFKKGQFEEHFAYVTTESGIKGPKNTTFYGLMGTYNQEALFPEGHYDALITAGRHESCIYLDKSLTINCEFEVPYELVMTHEGGAATPIVKSGSWPKQNSEMPGAPATIAYALTSSTAVLWARRNLVGDGSVWDATFNYASGDGNPGNGLEMPSQFVDPLDDLDPAFGRPIWAWRHNPSQGALKDVLNGQMGVDPAGYYLNMHASIDGDTALVPFDADSGMGFSGSYCFNALLGIDVRDTDPLCGAP